MEPDASPDKIAAMIHAYPKSRAIYVVAKLDVAGHLRNGPQTIDELAQRTQTHAPTLYRLLRALASEGIFAEMEPGTFAMTPAAHCLLTDAPHSQHAMAVMMGEEHYQAWGELLYSVQTGNKAFDKIYGMPIFEFLSQHPEQAAIFDAAMSSIHGREAAPMLDAYDFSPFGTIADIGGGNGSTLMAVLRQYPQARGVLFDLPHVIERASQHVAAAGLTERCELLTGDFFSAIPTGADLYMFRHIIHDWNDEQSVRILANCRQALAPDGKILLLESVIEPGNARSFGKWLDLTMLVIPGGKERTEQEYRHLLAQAGLRLLRIVRTRSEISLIEAEATA